MCGGHWKVDPVNSGILIDIDKNYFFLLLNREMVKQ